MANSRCYRRSTNGRTPPFRAALSGVARLERHVASLAVITKLVDLGYLHPGARHRVTAVERAIDRLRMDLVRQGVIFDSNLSFSSKDEGQRELVRHSDRRARVFSLPERRSRRR